MKCENCAQLQAKADEYERVLKLVDEVWTRSQLHPDVNFIGDDEHEAWSEVREVLSKHRQKEGTT